MALITDEAHKCITQLSADTSAKSKIPFFKNMYSTGAPFSTPSTLSPIFSTLTSTFSITGNSFWHLSFQSHTLCISGHQSLDSHPKYIFHVTIIYIQ